MHAASGTSMQWHAWSDDCSILQPCYAVHHLHLLVGRHCTRYAIWIHNMCTESCRGRECSGWTHTMYMVMYLRTHSYIWNEHGIWGEVGVGGELQQWKASTTFQAFLATWAQLNQFNICESSCWCVNAVLSFLPVHRQRPHDHCNYVCTMYVQTIHKCQLWSGKEHVPI